jgi:hypothetical protein
MRSQGQARECPCFQKQPLAAAAVLLARETVKGRGRLMASLAIIKLKLRLLLFCFGFYFKAHVNKLADCFGARIDTILKTEIINPF